MPCYNLLESLIPESRPLKEGVQQNLERWKGLADEQQAIKDAAAELEANEKSATAALNGESQQNETSDSAPPTATADTKISPKKRIQKQDSLPVPVNPANNDSNDSQ